MTHADSTLREQIKHFWRIYALLLVSLAGLAVYIYAGGVETPDTPKMSEDAYVKNILDIEPIDPPIYPTVTSDGELLVRSFPNLIVRCTATDREKCTVYDPYEVYTNKDLDGGNITASAYLTTPYLMEITEVYYGDPALWREGDLFYYYAQYGERAGFVMRYDHYAVFRVGREYIMYFNVQKRSDGQYYMELCHPGAVLEITAEDPNSFRLPSDYAEDIFDGYQYTLSRWEEGTHFLLEKYDYLLSKRIPQMPTLARSDK